MSELRKTIAEQLEIHLQHYALDIYNKAPEPDKNVYIDTILEATRLYYADLLKAAELGLKALKDLSSFWDTDLIRKPKKIDEDIAFVELAIKKTGE